MLIFIPVNQNRAVCKRKCFHRAVIGFAALCLVTLYASPLAAQSGAGNSYASPTPAVADAAGEMAGRIARARALAVVGQGVTAARELEAIRVATRNDSNQPVRGVAGVMLMGLYIEQADYRRAHSLLDEAHAQCTAATGGGMDDAGMRTYFAVAGQLLNGLRYRLERYKTYNVPVSGAEVPVEATADTEGMRVLLDALIQQARTWREAGGGSVTSGEASADASATPSSDAAALFEDSVGLRVNLARNGAERQALNRQLSDARQRLAAVEPRLQPETMRANPATANPTSGTATPATINTPKVITSAADNTVSNSANVERAPAATIISNASSAPDASSVIASTSSAAEGAALLDVGSLVERATQRPAPSYPQAARAARVSGVVTVYVVVNEKGSVEEVRRAAGPSLLRRAAEDAVRRWKFRPETRDGQPVKVAGHIAFNFAQ